MYIFISERKKKKGSSSIKKTPLAIFDFTTDDDELQIIDQSDDSRVRPHNHTQT